jgi:hypothetical protein
MRLKTGRAALFALSMAAASVMPQPSAARADKEDIARALAALAIIGIAANAKKDGDGWDEDRYGEPFSPSNGVTCLPKPRQCYQNGHLSYRWTRRIFGA